MRVLRNKYLLVVTLLLVLMANLVIVLADDDSVGDFQAIAGVDEVHATGEIEILESVVREGAPITMEIHSLNATWKYRVNWTSNNIGFTFVARGEESFVFVVDPPNTGNTVTFYLRVWQSGNEIDSLTLPYVFDKDVAQPIGQFIPIIIFGIIAFAVTVIPITVWRKK